MKNQRTFTSKIRAGVCGSTQLRLEYAARLSSGQVLLRSQVTAFPLFDLRKLLKLKELES
jgi:hypothetical protein